MITGQRQTALLAKQAAEIDVLTGGNFRLGLGIGWNPVEYEALGMNFHDRGRRLEEQIDLMLPFQAVRITTLVSPLLDPPEKDDVAGKAQGCFWPNVGG